ncbi:hypothetical protein BH10BAC5_BH10BAC5_16130 [soil metagenome]
MRKVYIYIVFLLSGISYPAFSQNGFNFNAGVGASLLNINYATGLSGIDTSYSSSFILSYFLGAEYKIRISNNILLGFNAGFSSKGGNFSKDSVITETGIIPVKTITNNLKYFELSIRPEYQFKLTKQYPAQLFGGIYTGFLLNATETISEVYSKRTRTFNENVVSNYNTLDIGFFFGAGIQIAKYLSAKVKYQTGLINILKSSDGFKDISSKNQSIYFVIGLRNSF